MHKVLSPRQIGRLSEQRVGEILQYLVEQEVLRGYRKTRHNSKADRHGVDFYLFTQGKRIPLQVKSSFSGMVLHNHYSHEKKVPCVVGSWPWNLLLDKITDIILMHEVPYYGR